MGAPARQRVVGSTTAAAVTVVLLWLVPRAAGTTWARVGNTFDQISAGNLAVLAVLWITGLWCHSFVLGAALPGLTRRRALTLNLTGSAVANVLPLGGAAGIGLNFAMVRRWGFGAPSFAAFTTVTNVLDVGSKISVTAVACAVLMSRGDALTGPLGAAGPILIGALGAGAVLATLVFSPAGATRCGLLLVGVVSRVCVQLRLRHRSRLAATLPHLGRTTLQVVRAHWLPLCLGTVAYAVCQGALLWWCFHAVGIDLAPAILLAGLAVDRLLTVLPLTPGAAGIVEAGLVTALVALGGPADIVAAAVLTYRGFTFLAEIPVGGVGIGLWLLQQRRARPPADATRRTAVVGVRG